MTAKSCPFDAARYLDSEGAIKEYLAATCEDGGPAGVAQAPGVVARGVSDLSRKTGLTLQTLYKALSGAGKSGFATIAKVAAAPGLWVSFVPVGEVKRKAAYINSCKCRLMSARLHGEPVEP